MRALSLLQEGAGAPDPGYLEQDLTTLSDLGIGQVVEAVTRGREEWDLGPLFCTRATRASTIGYRQAVFRDLENEKTRAAVAAFAESMRQARELVGKIEKRRHVLQQGAWFLQAVQVYCRAVQELADELANLELCSSGLRSWREFLSEHVAAPGFTSLHAEAASVRDQLDGIRYQVDVIGGRVTVRRHQGEADYGAEIRAMFARFQQAEGRSHLFKMPRRHELSQVEERILDLLVRLFPEPFSAQQGFWERHRDFWDPTVRRVDRELQFYLAYLEYIEPLRLAGLAFSYPEVRTDSKAERARGTFDLVMADRLVPAGVPVVVNDFELAGAERLLVVSGPNQGGKTTLARTFGQLHHLAALGCPVPGTELVLLLCDQLLTHFEREERLEDLRGRLEDDLVRVEEILTRATGRSVVILNETFGSASLEDGRELGRAVVEQLIGRDVVGVYVTFIVELSALGPATVSMVSRVDPDDPARRTFRVDRRPADGLAYALALAQRHGMTYSQLKRALQC
ncbi:MAG: MutS-related protein [Candidatus Dormibacteria bacterium]